MDTENTMTTSMKELATKLIDFAIPFTFTVSDNTITAQYDLRSQNAVYTPETRFIACPSSSWVEGNMLKVCWRFGEDGTVAVS
jgi:hypothetical protein